MADRPYPLVPKRLPDGRTVWEEAGKAKDLLDALRAYDPRMSLVRNHVDGQWEVWRRNEDESQGRVAIYVSELLPHESQLLADVHAHDTRHGYDPLEALARKETARRRAEDQAAEAIAAESADRMHYEFVDEFSAHMPAARPIPLGPNRATRR